jgi:hypothetical protein
LHNLHTGDDAFAGGAKQDWENETVCLPFGIGTLNLQKNERPAELYFDPLQPMNLAHEVE